MNTDTKEERMKRFSERMPALREKFQRMRERLYIERRLAEKRHRHQRTGGGMKATLLKYIDYLFNYEYRIALFENGKFCWKVHGWIKNYEEEGGD